MSLASDKPAMSYSRTKKTSATEKRLQLIREQLYGKEQNQRSEVKNPRSDINTKLEALVTSTLSPPPSLSTDYIDSIKRDLLKTLLLATFIIAIQLSLYMALTKDLIHF